MFRATQRGKQLLTLTLVQTENRVNVSTAIAVFGEKSGDGFCCMIGSHDNAAGHAGDTVLSLHTFTGFFIATDKIAQFNTRFTQGLFTGQYRTLNIDGEYAVRLDKGDGILTVLFISLNAIWQTYGNKLQRVIPRFFAKLGNSHLA